MSLQLDEGETILKEGGASHVKGIETVGGHLWLTNRRLFFQSHALNIQTHETSYPLQDIIAIRPDGTMPTWMYIGMKDGTEEKFVMFGREEWLKAISDASHSSAPIPSANPLQIASATITSSMSASIPPSNLAQTTLQPVLMYAPRPLKDRGVALILEILPGLFGFLGIGWIYAGNSGAGVAWLIGTIVWAVMAIIIVAATAGFGALCTIPVQIILLIVSAVSLSGYIKRRTDLFGS